MSDTPPTNTHDSLIEVEAGEPPADNTPAVSNNAQENDIETQEQQQQQQQQPEGATIDIEEQQPHTVEDRSADEAQVTVEPDPKSFSSSPTAAAAVVAQECVSLSSNPAMLINLCSQSECETPGIEEPSSSSQSFINMDLEHPLREDTATTDITMKQEETHEEKVTTELQQTSVPALSSSSSSMLSSATRTAAALSPSSITSVSDVSGGSDDRSTSSTAASPLCVGRLCDLLRSGWNPFDRFRMNKATQAHEDNKAETQQGHECDNNNVVVSDDELFRDESSHPFTPSNHVSPDATKSQPSAASDWSVGKSAEEDTSVDTAVRMMKVPLPDKQTDKQADKQTDKQARQVDTNPFSNNQSNNNRPSAPHRNNAATSSSSSSSSSSSTREPVQKAETASAYIKQSPKAQSSSSLSTSNSAPLPNTLAPPPRHSSDVVVLPTHPFVFPVLHSSLTLNSEFLRPLYAYLLQEHQLDVCNALYEYLYQNSPEVVNHIHRKWEEWKQRRRTAKFNGRATTRDEASSYRQTEQTWNDEDLGEEFLSELMVGVSDGVASSLRSGDHLFVKLNIEWHKLMRFACSSVSSISLPHLAVERPDLFHLGVRHWVCSFISKFSNMPPMHPPYLEQQLQQIYGHTFSQHPLFSYLIQGYVRSVSRLDTIGQSQGQTNSISRHGKGLNNFEGIVTFVGKPLTTRVARSRPDHGCLRRSRPDQLDMVYLVQQQLLCIKLTVNHSAKYSNKADTDVRAHCPMNTPNHPEYHDSIAGPRLALDDPHAACRATKQAMLDRHSSCLVSNGHSMLMLSLIIEDELVEQFSLGDRVTGIGERVTPDRLCGYDEELFHCVSRPSTSATVPAAQGNESIVILVNNLSVQSEFPPPARLKELHNEHKDVIGEIKASIRQQIADKVCPLPSATRLYQAPGGPQSLSNHHRHLLTRIKDGYRGIDLLDLCLTRAMTDGFCSAVSASSALHQVKLHLLLSLCSGGDVDGNEQDTDDQNQLSQDDTTDDTDTPCNYRLNVCCLSQDEQVRQVFLLAATFHPQSLCLSTLPASFQFAGDAHEQLLLLDIREYVSKSRKHVDTIEALLVKQQVAPQKTKIKRSNKYHKLNNYKSSQANSRTKHTGAAAGGVASPTPSRQLLWLLMKDKGADSKKKVLKEAFGQEWLLNEEEANLIKRFDLMSHVNTRFAPPNEGELVEVMNTWCKLIEREGKKEAPLTADQPQPPYLIHQSFPALVSLQHIFQQENLVKQVHFPAAIQK